MNPPGLNSCAAALRGLPRDGARLWVGGVVPPGVTDALNAPAAHDPDWRLAPNTKGLANGFNDSVRDPERA